MRSASKDGKLFVMAIGMLFFVYYPSSHISNSSGRCLCSRRGCSWWRLLLRWFCCRVYTFSSHFISSRNWSALFRFRFCRNTYWNRRCATHVYSTQLSNSCWRWNQCGNAIGKTGGNVFGSATIQSARCTKVCSVRIRLFIRLSLLTSDEHDHLGLPIDRFVCP